MPMLLPHVRVRTTPGRLLTISHPAHPALTVPDSERNRSTLRSLLDPGAPRPPTDDPLVGSLRQRGFVADSDLSATTPLPAVEVIGDPPPLVTTTLVQCGFTAFNRHVPDPACSDAGIALAWAPSDPEVPAQLTRAQIPHLVVRPLGPQLLLGPLVIPGETACCECIQMQRDDYVAASASEWSTREERDLAVEAIAAGWAVRDLRTWSTGGHPWTHSTTVMIGPNWDSSRRQSWLIHPECGCSWT